MRSRKSVVALFVPRRSARGAFVLLVIALILPLVTAALAVGVDVARGLAARRSLQGLAESAAAMAVLELDGTPEGQARASDRVMGALAPESHPEGNRAPEMNLEIDPSGRATVTVNGPPVAWLIPGFAGRRVTSRAAAAQVRWDPPPGRVLDLGLDGAEPRPGEWIALSRSEVAEGAAEACGAAVTVMAAEVDFDARVVRDTDRFSPDYEAYVRGRRGNGARILPVRIGGRVGGLFVARSPEPVGADPLWCGEFMGGFLEGAGNRAAAGEGYWRVEVDKH